MRRAVAVAALVAGVLPAALTGTSTAAETDAQPDRLPTRVVSGVVTEFVTEGSVEARGDRTQQALVSQRGIVPVKGAALTDGARVTARVMDVPGPVDEVVEVLSEQVVRPGPRAAWTGAVRHKVFVAFAAPKGTSVRDSMPSPTEVTRTINGPVSGYWSSQTGGLVTFRVAATTRRYASTKGCGDPWGLWEEARRKFGSAAYGANKHVLVIVPRSATNKGCSVGLGSVGSSVSSGGVSYVGLHSAAIYAHELGHNMGLGHADSLLCTGRQDTFFSAGGPRNAGCQHHSYDDYLEVMSSSGGTRGTGALNGAHVDDLGLLPSAIRKVAPGSSVTLRLGPLSGPSRSLRVAKVVESTGVAYFVQYRANKGIDAGKSPYRLGVELHREDPTSYRSTGTLFLDATPSGHYDLERSLPVGKTFTSAAGKVTVQVLSQSSTGATVLIRNRG